MHANVLRWELQNVKTRLDVGEPGWAIDRLKEVLFRLEKDDWQIEHNEDTEPDRDIKEDALKRWPDLQPGELKTYPAEPMLLSVPTPTLADLLGLGDRAGVVTIEFESRKP